MRTHITWVTAVLLAALLPLSAEKVAVQAATTANTDSSFISWSRHDDDNVKTDFAFNADLNVSYGKLGGNLKWGYQKEGEKQTVEPDFSLRVPFGKSQSWYFHLLTGPTFVLTDDDTAYGLNLHLLAEYQLNKTLFLRLGTGYTSIWKKENGDWKRNGELYIPELGFGLSF